MPVTGFAGNGHFIYRIVFQAFPGYAGNHMSDSFLTTILKDVGPFSAEYRPVPIAEKPVTGCDVPPATPSRLRLPTLPTIKNELDCNLNFVPVPIVPVPFIPPFEGPCPDGFHFEAQYVPSNGQCLLQLPPANGYRPIVLQNFTAADAGIDAQTEQALPDIRLTLPVTHSGTEISGTYKYPIVSGQMYSVTIDSYDAVNDQNKGMIYDGKLYKNGQSFRGVDGQAFAAVSHVSENARVFLSNVQHRQILDYDRTPGGNVVYVHQDGFILPNSDPVCTFTFNRLVISANPDKETGGNIQFIQETCGGKLIGEININFGDLNLPCAEGFSFDAGYSPKPNETLVVTDGNKVSSTTIDLVALVPSGVSPETGLIYPMPKLRINTTGSTWVEAQVQSVHNDIDGVWLVTSGLPNGTYDSWYLQRINVTSGSPTGGQFEFIRQGSCGGKLVGEIRIDVPELETPCATALQDNTLVSTATNFGVGADLSHPSDWRALKHTDRLRTNATPNQTGWVTEPPISKAITLDSYANSCNYKLGFNGGAEINLPDIQIQLRIGNDGQWQRFQRRYTDGVTDTITFEATVDKGQVGDPGGGSPASCLSCCRWS